MRLQLERYTSDGDRTRGILYADDAYVCHTLEDPPQETKISGRTRIPAGRYPVRTRTVGKWPARNAKRLPWHGKRSLEICDVPGFTAVLFHVGNSSADTRGCVLVGLGVHYPNRITQSWLAYERFARVVLRALDAGEEVELLITDPAVEEAAA